MVTRRVFDTVGRHYWVRYTSIFVDIVSNPLLGLKQYQGIVMGSYELCCMRTRARPGGRFQVSSSLRSPQI
jgi:hypothetical protein